MDCILLRPHVLQWTAGHSKEGKPGPADHVADPLHDPGADEEDQRWVVEQLMMPDSTNCRATDAVLNCPGCFMPICYQCQQHEKFARQWRATEVRNCAVDRSVSLSLSAGDPARYFAVRCATCGADVGLQDEEETYHLFQVLESVA